MLRDRMSTNEFAQILGITRFGIYWNIKNKSKEGFPAPVKLRNGTLFEFLLDDVQGWLSKKGIKPKIDISKLLQGSDIPLTRTTTEVLQQMNRKPTKGNRADLSRLIKEGRMPAPITRRVGRGGENLWLAEIIDPATQGWVSLQKFYVTSNQSFARFGKP